MKKFANIITYIKLKHILIVLSILICGLTLGLIDRGFWNNLTDSIKTTLESTKPTEELFDDTSGVKLINVLFGDNSCLVSTTPIDYDLQFSNYDNFINNNGVVTIIGANGILYAPYGGEITVNNLVDNVTEITINHGNNLYTIFSGKFGLGVKTGDFVLKGQPLALILGDTSFYIKQGTQIIDNFINSEESL